MCLPAETFFCSATMCLVGSSSRQSPRMQPDSPDESNPSKYVARRHPYPPGFRSIVHGLIAERQRTVRCILFGEKDL
ncbi:hypothetical protein L210DRAFT_946894 [Boletus edulis BED1]|uniref:Uncharacterized protein n=1 Tax=Boletus edulis BED1 TaxID=1328754 RepID=A0AAD4BIJ6_BOLED|nr:hypothetical protein L210DRAFT_946894 [Boletus edulis BED1]